MTDVLGALQIDEAAFRGQVLGPGDAGLRRPPQDLERLVRPAPGGDHPLRGVSDVIAAVKFGRASGICRSRSAAAGTRSRACRRGRRPDDRPLADEGRPGRPGSPDRTGAGGRAARRARSGDAGVRPGGARPDRHAHRRGRAHAGRRDRLDHAQARAVDRPARLCRPRHCRRRARPGERRGERRPLLGRARRRRQLRHRHRVRVPLRAARASDPGRTGVLADGAVAARCCASTATGSPRRRTS